MSERCRYRECPYWDTHPYDYVHGEDGQVVALCDECKFDKERGVVWSSFWLRRKEASDD